MKLLYLDVGAGAAGDMLAGALLELLPAAERAEFLQRMGALIPGVAAAGEAAAQCGVTGTHFAVTVNGEAERADGRRPEHAHHHHHDHDHDHAHDHDHHHDHAHDHDHDHHHDHAHAGMAEIEAMAAQMALSESERADVLDVYRAIAAAESAVHGVPVTEIHFHELGTLDALADISAVTLLLRALGSPHVVASPVAVGRGTVRCAHGILPVPAPATALLLRGVPSCAGRGEGELCTPTGAALLGKYVSEFGPLPAMTPEAVGYGFGAKEFADHPNCVRAIYGEALTPPAAAETVVELSCNLDDMTPEAVGFAIERLYEAGALEAFTTSVGMKKNRPGVLLTALCREDARGAVLRSMLTHTSTLGVRERTLARHVLEREIETVETQFGPVRRKVARGFGAERRKWEYDDVARIARERGMALEAVRRALDDGCAD